MLSGATTAEILAFWFTTDSGDGASYRVARKRWFRKSETFDYQVRQRFMADYRAARTQAIARPDLLALDSAEASLALTLLFDQLPRNMFRGTPAAFASDPQARAVAKEAIARGFDQALPPVRRMFFYFPFEHSESLVDQRQAAALFHALVQQSPELEDTYDYALRHQQIIERFGRFPHRNPILGRRSTPAEVSFLKQPGSGF